MTWAKLDDGFVDNPKVEPVSWAARGVWVTALSWCARKLTDGRVTRKAASILEFPDEAVAELVAAGLWDELEDGGGWVVHDYLVYNPSKDEVVVERNFAKQRRVKARDRRGKKRSDASPLQTEFASATPDPDPVKRSCSVNSEIDLKPLVSTETPLRPSQPTAVGTVATVHELFRTPLPEPPPGVEPRPLNLASLIKRLHRAASEQARPGAKPKASDEAADALAKFCAASAPRYGLTPETLAEKIITGLFASRGNAVRAGFPLGFASTCPEEFLTIQPDSRGSVARSSGRFKPGGIAGTYDSDERGQELSGAIGAAE
jgi:hypothetical protein